MSEPPVAVTLAIGLLKGDQMSAVTRDATAMGVAAIVPFVSHHVAMPALAGRAKLVERLTRIAISSAAQCGRAVVPAIRDVTTLEAVLAAAGNGARLICVEPALAATAAPWAATARPQAATLLVGPEGGWAEAEVSGALAQGAVPVSLGPRTLRAEIAPTVALGVLWGRWGWT